MVRGGRSPGLGVIVAALGGALLVPGCGATQESIEFEGPSFASVSEMMQTADATVRVKITRELGRELDDGGNAGVEDYEGGIPMVVLQGTVTDSYGSSATPGTIEILYLDGSSPEIQESYRELRVGDEIILAYERLTQEDMPGISAVSTAFVPVAGQYGVLDVAADGTVSPRGEQMTGLQAPDDKSDPGAPQRAARTTGWDLADVERLAEESNSESENG